MSELPGFLEAGAYVVPKTKRVHTGSTTVDLGRLVDQMRREGRVTRRVWGVCEGPSPGYPNVESNGYPRPDRGPVPALLSAIGLGVCLGLVPLDFVAAFAFARAGAFASGAPTVSALAIGGVVPWTASRGLGEAVPKKRVPMPP